MAHDKPVPTHGRRRLHVYGSDTTTDVGSIEGQGVDAHHSKDFTESTLSLSVSTAEAVLAADETVLSKAFVQPEADVDGVWTEFGTPYLLAPGSGGVRGGSFRTQSPVAVGALRGLLDQLIVFPSEVDVDSPTFKRAGGLERNRYMDFTSKHYSQSLHTWNACAVYDATGQRKDKKPDGWEDDDAAWTFRDADEGGRTCFIFRNVDDDAYYFTLTVRQRVVIRWCSDENAAVFLDGPNQGGKIIDWSADEDGYNQGAGRWSQRLEPGTYKVTAWMLTVNSEGGDGNDSGRLSVWSIKTDGSGDRDAYLMRSDANTMVLRQPTDDPLPGMSPGEAVRRLLDECVTVADANSNAAQLLLDNRTFTDTLDTLEADWTSFIGYVAPLGASLASILSDMLGEVSWDMSPGFAFDGYQDRTEDHGSTPGTGLSTVELKGGAAPPSADMNIGTYDYESDPAGPNAMLGESQEGLLYVEDATIGDDWRRFGQAELGGTATAGGAKRAIRKQLHDNGDERRYYSCRALPVAGATPYAELGGDFGLEATVHGRGYRDLGLDLEVTGIGWGSGDVPMWDYTLAEA